MSDHPVELLTCAQMAEADRLTMVAGTPGIELMERAGASIADAVRQELSRRGGKSVVVLCGPGNNGGDGFVAARLLRQMGYSVTAGLLGKREALRSDAAQAAASWSGKTGSAALVDLAGADLVIDALFGAGLSRDIDGRARAIIERLNEWRENTGRPVVAVDMPSGIDGDTGTVRGVAVQADVTVTFFRLKPGHVLLPGRGHCGNLVLAGIGISDAVLDTIRPEATLNGPAMWRRHLALPGLTSHKYSRGHALVVSGPAHQTGAARLAARGALRGGAGLVTIAAQGDAVAVNAAHLTAIMLAPYAGAEGLAGLLDDKRKTVAVIGPGAGAGEETRRSVEALLTHRNAPAVVLDADALTSFGGRFEQLANVIKASVRPAILTPHEGEFSNLFKDQELVFDSDSQLEQAGLRPVESVSEVAPLARIIRARASARLSGAVICLKGPDTIVAMPHGRASIMAEAPAWLATAGSGDVLAGIIAGLLAQQMPVFEACSAAVWMHARAARMFGPGLIAEDIPEKLPAVWAELSGSLSG